MLFANDGHFVQYRKSALAIRQLFGLYVHLAEYLIGLFSITDRPLLSRSHSITHAMRTADQFSRSITLQWMLEGGTSEAIGENGNQENEGR